MSDGEEGGKEWDFDCTRGSAKPDPGYVLRQAHMRICRTEKWGGIFLAIRHTQAHIQRICALNMPGRFSPSPSSCQNGSLTSFFGRVFEGSTRLRRRYRCRANLHTCSARVLQQPTKFFLNFCSPTLYALAKKLCCFAKNDLVRPPKREEYFRRKNEPQLPNRREDNYEERRFICGAADRSGRSKSCSYFCCCGGGLLLT